MGFSITDIFITAFFIFGLNAITRPDKLLWGVSRVTSYRGENTFSLANVVAECCVCMSSLYGIAIYFYLAREAPSYNATTILLATSAVMFALVEISCAYILGAIEALRPISDTPKEYKRKKALVKSLKLIAGRVSVATYSACIGYTAYTFQYYDCLLYIVSVAGVGTILEAAIKIVKATEQTANSLADQNDIAINLGNKVLENLKN